MAEGFEGGGGGQQNWIKKSKSNNIKIFLEMWKMLIQVRKRQRSAFP
mgnify:CR=1 FL=1